MRWIWLVGLSTACFVTDTELEQALDRDGDGYLPVVAGGDDCNEGRADIHPGADELCGDGLDNNCDGFPDDDGVGSRDWYLDEDGDGFGVDASVTACTEPEGYAPFPGDCDDHDPSLNPAAVDLCDEIDQDCDGVIDDDAIFTLTFFDADGDGFGVVTDTMESCGATPGYVLQDGDCDDLDSEIRPGSVDPCDGVDQDCDGQLDEDAEFALWFADADGDGIGTVENTRSTCDGAPAGFVANPGDCDDTDAEVVIPSWYPDGDLDGHGAGSAVLGCDAPSGHVAPADDCDDANALRSPSQPEVCMNGVDDDCSAATHCRLVGTVDVGPALWTSPDPITFDFASDFLGGPEPDVFVNASGMTWVVDGATLDFANPAAVIPERIGFPSGDANGDGRDEVYRASSNQNVTVYASGGAGNLTPFLQIPPAAHSGGFIAVGEWGTLGPGVWSIADDEPTRLQFWPWQAGEVDPLASSESIDLGPEVCDPCQFLATLSGPDGRHGLGLGGANAYALAGADAVQNAVSGSLGLVADVAFEDPGSISIPIRFPVWGYPHLAYVLSASSVSVADLLWIDGDLTVPPSAAPRAMGPAGDVDGDSHLDFMESQFGEVEFTELLYGGRSGPTGSAFLAFDDFLNAKIIHGAVTGEFNGDGYTDILILVEGQTTNERTVHLVMGRGQ